MMFAASPLKCVFRYMNLTATGNASISPEKNGISNEGKLYEVDEDGTLVAASGGFENGFGEGVWSPKGRMLVGAGGRVDWGLPNPGGTRGHWSPCGGFPASLARGSWSTGATEEGSDGRS
ncbi:unnamed protein product [Cylicocyclus nassatus]|uniref:Uncharacterized protein n=1 Tax=Cylicocyclus nassatus TaxID=53992 RepID=A0AA36DL74_CYLNA|nr:unnamed protein product [Cylicocyclus nassatus]